MKAQAALEFLYTYGFVIILALVVIALIFHYFSLSLGTAPQCLLPHYLNCEQFMVTPTDLTLNVTNNFNYDLKIRRVAVITKGEEFISTPDVEVKRGESTLLTVSFTSPIEGPQFSGKLNITYSPCVSGTCSSDTYSIIGYVSAPIESS